MGFKSKESDTLLVTWQIEAYFSCVIHEALVVSVCCEVMSSLWYKSQTPKFIEWCKQESPPAWTQEAYRPRRIKYSICFPKWGTPGRVAPQAGLMGDLRWGTPSGRVPPWPGLMGGGTRGGVLPGRVPPLTGVPPGQVWWGVNKVDLAGVPSPGWTWLGYPPPHGQTDGWMDRHMWKHYLPVLLRTQSVMI